MDPRHEKRITTVQNLFAKTFRVEEGKSEPPHKDEKTSEQVLKHQEQINALIQKYAPKYPIDKIARIDICVLQLAIYELKFAEKKEPTKVVINEAVEIAKELGNERSFAFVNAVLGSIQKEISSEMTDGNKT